MLCSGHIHTCGLKPHIHLEAKRNNTRDCIIHAWMVAHSHMSSGILIDCSQTRPRNVKDGKVLTRASQIWQLCLPLRRSYYTYVRLTKGKTINVRTRASIRRSWLRPQCLCSYKAGQPCGLAGGCVHCRYTGQHTSVLDNMPACTLNRLSLPLYMYTK